VAKADKSILANWLTKQQLIQVIITPEASLFEYYCNGNREFLTPNGMSGIASWISISE